MLAYCTRFADDWHPDLYELAACMLFLRLDLPAQGCVVHVGMFALDGVAPASIPSESFVVF